MASSKSQGQTAPERVTVNLDAYPDLVVIYLGMQARSLRGVKTLAGFGPKIKKAVAAGPDGLLLHEDFWFSFVPPHAGMRQYWRDFDSLERWPEREPIQSGGRVFCATGVEPASGTRPIFGEARSSPSTSTCRP